MESPQRDPRPHTPPTTIQAGFDTTHDETDYHLLILRRDAIQIPPELLLMRHPTISMHHPFMPVLTPFQNSHPGSPYRAVLSITLCKITRHTEGQYCTT